MHYIELLYLSMIVVGICTAYIVLLYIAQYLFKDKAYGFSQRSVVSILKLAICSSVIIFISLYVIPSKVWGNRFMHAIGGGYMVFLLCYYVIRDARISMPRPVFFFIGFVAVTLLGLFNEVAEIYVQNKTGVILSPNLTDTLLDLLSNTFGYCLGYIIVMNLWPSGCHEGQRRTVDRR